MQTYNDYCAKNGIDLYGSRKVELPKPELYVIFTGDRKDHPEVLSLNDEFWGGKAMVDAKVKVIYDGQPKKPWKRICFCGQRISFANRRCLCCRQLNMK